MSFNKTAALKGSTVSYQLNPDCKKYTLRDYGFIDTKAGNYQYEILVKPEVGDRREVLLRITVDKNVSGLKLVTTNKTGLQAINIYQHEDMQPIADKINYILADMVDRKVLAPVEEAAEE